MSRRIRRTRQVRDDIIQIYGYVHPRSPQSAERVLDAIERSVRNLLHTPGIGRRWDSPDPRLDGMRVVIVTPYRAYVIFFRPVPSGIEVFRIVHGARELSHVVDDIEIDFDDDE